MARKNVFASVIEQDGDKAPDARAPMDYVPTGASRTLLSSFTEMAEQAERLREGETIIEVDPELVDDSFARDRYDLDDPEYSAEYAQVRDAIRTHGQDTPALVRPHPRRAGSYMLVFGHLRKRIAIDLGRKLRVVVREMSDRDHIIAQGQENTGRANTSFIEKARFAANIVERKLDSDNSTVFEALRIDAATLSKMLAVASLPKNLLDRIGRAQKTGRDRWYELKQMLDRPGNLEIAMASLEESGFVDLRSDARFDLILSRLKSSKSRRRNSLQPAKRSWAPPDGRVAAEMIGDGKRYTIAIKAKGPDALAFGDYLSESLNDLYAAFRKAKSATKDGD
ncbi:MAG: plasmid partitioning protein RepB [Rhizobiaceae bacterium]|nr:plasmid partitioning protein RepB [Rhizobiaceae bacterium]